ncbi:MAG: polyprenyl synthetase family protein [bacterium]
MNRLKKYLDSRVPLLEKALDRIAGSISGCPPLLRRAMDYSMKAGGKRLRPVLVFASAEAFGCPARKVLPAACALEMIHTYSLIHDDLPAMDDDNLRRGRPTNHRIFGEGNAILAGDALLTHAFKILSSNVSEKGITQENVLKAVKALSERAGAGGMVGGQAADLLAEGILRPGSETEKRRNGEITKRFFAHSPTRPFTHSPIRLFSKSPSRLLNYIHRHKTADLIRASVEIGAMLAGGSSAQIRSMSEYGLSIGLAFQITDDILDLTGDRKKLGKTGSDARNLKLTCVSLYGLEKAVKKARYWVARAHSCLSGLRIPPLRSAPLHDMADFIIARDR